MEFRVKRTYGSEVRFAGIRSKPPLKVYSAPKETGYWWIDLQRFEAYLSEHLRDQAFGSSVQSFVFGFEIADIAGWGRIFTATSNYISYRPKIKTLISVGQVNYLDVKRKRPTAQLAELIRALKDAVDRVATMKRKPSDFDYISFAETVVKLAKACPVDHVAWRKVVA